MPLVDVNLANLRYHDNSVVYHADDGVLEVCTPNAFTKVCGHIRYGQPNSPMFFRGQSELFPSLAPTGARGTNGILHQNGIQRHRQAIGELIVELDRENAWVGNVPDFAKEPLLQHYGIKTLWLDAVDNPWVALWFSIHRFVGHGLHGRYWHFEPRDPFAFVDHRVRGEGRYLGHGGTRTVSQYLPEYAYILIVTIGPCSPDVNRPGMYVSESGEMIDLRRSVPSTYLRPHAQHGLLFKQSLPPHQDHNYAECVCARLKVKVELAMRWIGQGQFTDLHSVFPPAVHDDGYQKLIERCRHGSETLGTIGIL
ncbi:MAG: FRG domain-containing protein [Spiribacter salinus]|uniref:FRG domain-containing protein n=1 Tax=Spiribacter salinus TaxID=1335746 RepID=A0A540VPA5_9GAMM|nr:MAG: FRG domain-containing protein [Spiribacter salinus]